MISLTGLIKTTGAECFPDTIMVEATKDSTSDSQARKDVVQDILQKRDNLHYCEQSSLLRIE